MSVTFCDRGEGSASRSSHLIEVSEELYGHLEQDLVLMDASCEALADLDQFVYDLVLLSPGIPLQGQ